VSPDLFTSSPDDTRAAGMEMGKKLSPGDVVAISGELGAGKTTFIKGLAEGLGVSEFVSSPSFIIINEYNGRIPLFHVDLYRLRGNKEVIDINLPEYFDRQGVVAIEWAEKAKGILPENTIEVLIDPLGEKKRKIRIRRRAC